MNRSHNHLLDTNAISRNLLTPKQIKYLKDSKVAEFLSWDNLYDYLYSVWYYDIDDFMDIFLSHRKEDPATWKRVDSWRVHKEIDVAYESGENLNLILPRGFAKTTRVLANVLHDLLYWEREDIWYLAWGDLWLVSIWRIRVELETNPILLSVFGRLSPEDQNSAKVKKLKKRKQQWLQLVNWNSVETLSPWQRIRWRRKKKWIIDDPDEDKDSRNQRKRFRSFVFTTIYNTMMPWGFIVTIWTIVWSDCFVLHLKNEKKWETIMYKAIENGESIRPQMRPLEALKKRKEAIWTNEFNQEFMHVPLSSEDALIRMTWIKRRKELPKFERTVLSIDPAKKEKESSDYTWIVFGGIARGKYYVIRTKQVKLSPMKLERYIIALIKKLSPDFLLKEDNIELQMTERIASKWYSIVGIHASNDKWSRLYDVSPEVERWDVLFPEEWAEELLYQICNYPNVKNDDLMDAFTQFVLNWLTVTNNDIYAI